MSSALLRSHPHSLHTYEFEILTFPHRYSPFIERLTDFAAFLTNLISGSLQDSDIQAVSLLNMDFASLGSDSEGDLFLTLEGCWCSNTAQDSFILLMPSRYLRHVRGRRLSGRGIGYKDQEGREKMDRRDGYDQVG
jgi:hypothetical protein